MAKKKYYVLVGDFNVNHRSGEATLAERKGPNTERLYILGGSPKGLTTSRSQLDAPRFRGAAVRATLKVDGPCVVQYPKDGIVPYAQNVTGEPFAVGKWQTLIPGGQDAVILAYGRMTLNAIQASELLVKCGLSVGVIDCCSLKPMDMD